MGERRANCHRTESTAPVAGEPAAQTRVSVLLPLPLEGAYDYRAAEVHGVAPGDFVSVPLGRREVVGVVWGPGSDGVAEERLKDVVARLDAPPMPEVARRFVDWVASYTVSPPGAVLRMAMSVPAALEPSRPVLAWRAASRPLPLSPPARGGGACDVGEDEFEEASEEGQSESAHAVENPLPLREGSGGGVVLTKARRRVLDVLADGPPRTTMDLAREAGVSAGVVKSMAAVGLIESVLLPPRAAFVVPDPNRIGPVLSPAQADAAAALVRKVEENAAGVTLLDGVTGSGKTEVYFEAMAAALKQGRQVLVLLPEIALGAQWLARFAARFGAAPAQWHSDLTAAERRVTWRAVATGAARVVVGARSALFLPYPELGLIVVDEEQDQAFKQEDGVVYQARDMAVVRGHLGRFPVVLVSATPSLETVTNVASGRYESLHLPDRHAGAALPKIVAVDMRANRPPRQSWLSPPLRAALDETLEAGEQAMLFLNRRGYAPLTLCRACGHRMQCPQCTAWLVEHRLIGVLQCHHCGFETRVPPKCPACGAEHSFAACGPGVERLAEEVAAVLPQARVGVMTSDTVPGPLAAAELVRRVEAHEIDLLIGTQIVAKGHHFPMLTLVGVIDADLGLQGGDLRAAERTFQLLDQVSGRAGRAAHPGRVLLQTYEPQHPVIKALVARDRDGFLDSEAEARRAAGLPPFGRLAALVVSGPDADAVDRVASMLARTAPHEPGVRVLGPALAPLAVLRGRHRRRFLMKCRRDVMPQPVVRRWLAAVKQPASVRIQVDIDPYSFL
jgi:primosomal protein N' (replication factor Y) (superfamily II helicase)